jgi:hypothetical protein
MHAIWATPCIINAGYPRAVQTRVAPLCLEELGAGSSPELPAPGQAPLEKSESKEEASANWVTHFDSAQSREGMGAGVLLVSPTGQLRKYAIQLAFRREGCASSTAECEALLASLRIAAEMGISYLSI